MGLLASIFLLCAMIVGWVMFFYFGPRSWFLSFAVGFGSIAAFSWLAFRYPVLVSAAGSSATGRAGASVVTAVLNSAADVKQAQTTFAIIARWGLTLLFAVPAALCIILSVVGASGIAGSVPKDLHGLGLLTGILVATAGVAWFNIGRF